MKREWKPGDVALTGLGHVLFCHEDIDDPEAPLRWLFNDGSGCRIIEHHVRDARPLVVIDPEDREQVERLCTAMKANGWTGIDEEAPSDMQTVLRSLIEPPKPEEPTGLGAVVEDGNGEVFIRHDGALAPWYAVAARDSDRPWRYYVDIAAVRVLSEGVRP